MCVQDSEGVLKLVLGNKVLIQRCVQESDKNSDVVKALVRASPSYSSSALTSLLGISKDDNCESRLIHCCCGIIIVCSWCNQFWSHSAYATELCCLYYWCLSSPPDCSAHFRRAWEHFWSAGWSGEQGPLFESVLQYIQWEICVSP